MTSTKTEYLNPFNDVAFKLIFGQARNKSLKFRICILPFGIGPDAIHSVHPYIPIEWKSESCVELEEL
jgi:hypothetical protein